MQTKHNATLRGVVWYLRSCCKERRVARKNVTELRELNRVVRERIERLTRKEK